MDAVLYARVSTIEQETQRQVTELLEYGKNLGFNVTQIFTEKISGTTQQQTRPTFMAMEAYIKEHNIKHVICHELSRIGRNLRHTVNIIYDFIDQGICIHTKSENIRTLNPDGTKNPDAMFRVGMFASIAEMEVETMRTRIKSGLRNSKLNGGSNTAAQPYGFQSINRKLAIEPNEAELVREIYSKYLAGFSMNRIAQHLNDLGIKTRKNRNWVDKTINDILTNSLYKGERYHNGEKMPYDLEVIIPEEKWEQVQTLIKDKSIYNNRQSKNINLLKGLVYCGKCGEPLYMHRRKDLSDNVYKCLSSKTGYKAKSCGLKGINVDLLNIYAFTLALQSGTLDHQKLSYKIQQHNQELQKKIGTLEQRLKEMDNELSTLTSGYAKGLVKEHILAAQVAEYDKESADIESRIHQYKRQLKAVPEPSKDLNIDMSGENLIGEFKKCITRITIENIPLHETKFNQRKDNVAYKITTVMWEYETITSYLSSRDKRLFDEDWNYNGVNFENAKKIQI
jgi:DNA invertase Pin-like site-specific DNA recombinase